MGQIYAVPMKLDHETCYRAVQARDRRFDGRFFTAVLTTKIYCRPICPAPTPKRENCVFLSCAAAAHENGFRPCLRCRPEISPGLFAQFEGTAVVSRALNLIAEGALDDGKVADLAEQVGVGDRHLRRLFTEHLGASPLAVAQTRRILFAKQLIDETSLSMTDVAMAAGFMSIRRFNEVMQKTYQRSPRELRRIHVSENPEDSPTPAEITLKLPFNPPYHWSALVRFLAPRAIPGVEAVDSDSYCRTICLDGLHGIVEVRPVEGQNYLLAKIRFPKVGAIAPIVERLRRLFDLNANATEISAHLERDPRIQERVAALPGLRVPGAWDSFELAVQAILGQQISVAAATKLAGRLAEAYGEPLNLEAPTETPLQLVFPRPEVLAIADLTQLGLTRARAQAISSLATAVAEGQVLHNFPSLESAVQTLCKLPGIGEWTAHYIAMRALREPDAFPATDLGLRRSLSPGNPLTKAELLEMAQSWRPWRAYAAMYLWLSEGVKE